MERKILLATTNSTKVEKMKYCLEGLGFNYLAIDDFEQKPEFDETGESYEQNAIIKALAWSKIVDCLVMASDGGVTIPVLGRKWNGLATHRFAGETASEIDRCEALLKIMAKHQEPGQRIIYWNEGLAVAKKGRLVVSWEESGEKGFLAKTYDKQKMLAGWWLASLWIVPGTERIYSELNDNERRVEDDSHGVWLQLKQKVQEFFKNA